MNQRLIRPWAERLDIPYDNHAEPHPFILSNIPPGHGALLEYQPKYNGAARHYALVEGKDVVVVTSDPAVRHRIRKENPYSPNVEVLLTHEFLFDWRHYEVIVIGETLSTVTHPERTREEHNRALEDIVSRLASRLKPEGIVIGRVRATEDPMNARGNFLAPGTYFAHTKNHYRGLSLYTEEVPRQAARFYDERKLVNLLKKYGIGVTKIPPDEEPSDIGDFNFKYLMFKGIKIITPKKKKPKPETIQAVRNELAGEDKDAPLAAV